MDKKTVDKIPTLCGVYLFKKGAEILYIGKSVNLRARIRSHIKNAQLDAKEAAIVNQTDLIDYITTDSEFKALLLESHLIQEHKPKYNVRWRDDKSYLYLEITRNEIYPKVLLTRKPDLAPDKKSSLFFGPFSSTRETEAVLKEVRKIYPFCTQKKIGKFPCFYSKIGLCNPCPNVIEKTSNNNVRKELKTRYKKNIKQVIKILSGKFEQILNDLNRELKLLTREENYEQALQVRNKMQRLEYLMHEKRFVDNSAALYSNNSKKSLDFLYKLLLNYFPKLKNLGRIECFDVSNLNFREATASLVVLTKGIPDKSQYKRFKIKNLKVQSDFEMLREVINRRLKNSWPLPNLFIVDGGKPQVRTLLKALLTKNITTPVIGIAKHPDRFVIGTEALPTLRLRNDNQALKLVQIVRDESHRFAKKYHLYLRSHKYLV